MTWRLEVNHATGFRYAAPVIASYNEARMTPATDARQTTIRSILETTPMVPLQRYWDYWGTQVVAFDVHQPHDELNVSATSVVETEAAGEPPTDTSWDLLADPDQVDRWGEYLMPSRYVPRVSEINKIGKDLRRSCPDPTAAVLAACEWVHSHLAYETGVTHVHSSAADALAEKRGVCQDFAHVSLAILRSMGIPGRYVSGYLYPGAEVRPGTRVQGDSHAWIEAWTGIWWGRDPTNGRDVDERHVTVALGRDYSDVPPFRGTYSGGASSSLGVTVELTRLR